MQIVPDGEIHCAVTSGVIDPLRGDDAVHSLERSAQRHLVTRQHTRRAQEGKGINVRAVHDHRDAHGRTRIKIIYPVNQFSGVQNRLIHRGYEETRAFLRHMDTLAHLVRIKIADLCRLAHAQIVDARRTRCTACHRNDSEIRLRLEHDRHFLRRCSIVQMIVKNARRSHHRITVENPRLFDILGTVRKEQRPARIVRLHFPPVHHARRLLRNPLRRDPVIAEDCGNTAANAPFRRAALPHNRCPSGWMRLCASRRREEQRGTKRRDP